MTHISGTKFILVCAGNLMRRKEEVEIIEAFAQCADKVWSDDVSDS